MTPLAPPRTPVPTAALSTFDVNEWTTYPLPTTASWQAATQDDPDTKLTLQWAQQGSLDTIEKKAFFTYTWQREMNANRLESENGILNCYKTSRLASIRQLRTRVVPRGLIPTLLAACHLSPMPGHMDRNKTYYRVATRYWWPRMLKDVRNFVTECAHCRVANLSNHEAQAILGTINAEAPFDIIFLDVWTPGTVATDYGESKILTCLEAITGFADGALLRN
jgi:hypothetical protein